MTTLWDKTVSILRGDGTTRDGPANLSAPTLLCLIFLCGGIYGAAMGSYNALGSPRALQALFSAVKVPLLIAATFCLCLPSFYILNSVMGLRDDFTTALHALLSSQAGQMALLASLTPYVLVWNASCSAHELTILFNGLMFGISTLGGQLILRRAYRGLITRDPRHRIALRSWVVIYAFVGIQLSWTMRPFVGAPHAATSFFRADSLTNAYIALFEIIRRALNL